MLRYGKIRHLINNLIKYLTKFHNGARSKNFYLHKPRSLDNMSPDKICVVKVSIQLAKHEFCTNCILSGFLISIMNIS